MVDPLEAFLLERGLVRGPLTVRRVGDGHSNVTRLVTGSDGAVVVRQPPPPPTPAGSYDVLREARTIAALAGSAVPVPTVLATAEAGQVLDVPLFVMSYEPGPVVTTQLPAALDDHEVRHRVGLALVDVLAGLHAVDRVAAGLRGRADGSNLRHHRRFARLVADDEGGVPQEFVALDDWLVRHVPDETGASLLHHDFRLGNVVLDPSRPDPIVAVLDWELAAVGDPLADLGYLVATWAEPDRPLTPIEELGSATVAPGFPARVELAERYATLTGRDLAPLSWHVANAYWKLAVLYEFSRRRGQDPYYADPSLVTRLLAAGEAAVA